ncbi:hypothetical protein [Streptomyces sp. NPDC056069]|uniref:hypothetical protein n=1 Tax=Streptomyces sp. NPDC056069 TaxID=3345702 RepID=UPI0035DE86AB
MTNADMVKRVIAMLTEARAEMAVLRQDPEHRRASSAPQAHLLDELMREALQVQLLVPSSVASAEVAERIATMASRALQPRIVQMVVSFAAAFDRLATAHDEGRIDVSSTDVLRQLALDWEMADRPAD